MRLAYLFVLASLLGNTHPPLIGGVSSQTPLAFTSYPGFPRSEPTPKIDFASPSVVDLSGDGTREVLVSDSKGCIYAWNSQGTLLSGYPVCTGTDVRINGPLAIANLDGDTALEIVAGGRGVSNNSGQRGKIYVWDSVTRQLQWSREMEWSGPHANATSEVYSVALANFVGTSQLEVLAGTNNNASNGGVPDVDIPRNVYALDAASGTVLSGFPTYYRTAGIFGGIGAADLDGNGYAEIVTGRDHLYVHAYRPTGAQLSGWPARTMYDLTKTVFGRDAYVEFTHNAPSMGDLNGDGQIDVVIAGKVRNGAGTTTNSTVMVLETNGQRPGCWSLPPLAGPPLESEFRPSMAPALADLNGDGKLEIVVSLFDGTLRAYAFGGALLWSHDYGQGRVLFASEPAIGDVTGDGYLDVVFGTYSPDGSANNYVGLWILTLNAEGSPSGAQSLSLTLENTASTRGVRAAPTLTDLDGDGDVEILAASWAGHVYAWTSTAAYDPARMPWPTGRHDNLRTGAADPLASPRRQPPATLPVNAVGDYMVYLPLTAKNYCTW